MLQNVYISLTDNMTARKAGIYKNVEMIIFWKWCKIETLLLRTTQELRSKWYVMLNHVIFEHLE